MIINNNERIRLLLCNIKEREPGSMEKDGKEITWDAAVQLVGIPWEDTRGLTQKFTIEPDCVDDIVQKLEAVHWGCIVDLSLSNKKVVDLKIVEDVMLPIYRNEPIDI